MQTIKKFCRLLICACCLCAMATNVYALDNLPNGNVGEYGNWLNIDNSETFKQNLIDDANNYQKGFQSYVTASDFVPIEVKIGLMFMKALSSIDYVLQNSLVRFTILFLIIAYAFWVGLEAYKIIRDSNDYKTVFVEMFKKGMIISMWLIVLEFGVTEIFSFIISPILSIGIYLSNFILDTVANTYQIKMPDTCATIHTYIDANAGKMLINPDTAANIMCLPARLSVYFYNAISMSLKWMIYGFTNSPMAIIVGGYCAYMFFKCVLKYAFMTLGIVADLFLTLLMLPFTALSEAAPKSSEKNYAGQIFNGLLGIFSTKKLSDVINVFISAALYFIGLSITIGISAALLANIISIDANGSYTTASAMTTLLCGLLILHLASKTDDFTKALGGSINNTFGKQMQENVKTLYNDAKSFVGKIYKDVTKK